MRKPSHNQILPTLTETISTADALGFYEGVALASMEGVRMRVSYAVQRKHFGKIVFGKKAVTVNTDGSVTVEYSAGYNSTSWESVEASFSAVCNDIGTFWNESFKAGLF